MALIASDRELQTIVRRAGVGHKVLRREVLWDWMLSHVERVFLGNNDSAIVKRSRDPLVHEGRILKHLRGTDIPLADLLFSGCRGGVLTLVLEDLGPSIRESTLQEAAIAAVRTHATPPPRRLRVLDAVGLAELPSLALDGLERLSRIGRWPDRGAVRESLVLVQKAASRLSQGATLPPFGLCHSEFHPTSLHIGERKTGLLDWAQAFVGPGLLDLASYDGTVGPPDSDACRALIDAYVDEGGPPEAAAPRAGLHAERWALFWHRIWAVEWYVRSCATWMDDVSNDAAYQDAVHRHLGEALNMADGE